MCALPFLHQEDALKLWPGFKQLKFPSRLYIFCFLFYFFIGKQAKAPLNIQKVYKEHQNKKEKEKGKNPQNPKTKGNPNIPTGTNPQKPKT